jgi:glycosyltransferase involved in cell wall biosynthesis
LNSVKFVIITHVSHVCKKSEYWGYSPYIREMNIWLKYADEIIVVAPLSTGNPTAIDLAYTHSNISFKKVSNFNLTDVREIIVTILKLPSIFWKIFWAMKGGNHIHLRCPGNMGLIGCFVQILFPNKIKTAKYAGNWDPKSKQPWSYRLQKWILSNEFLTRNMQVLVYGDWENQSKNIKPFFTASYYENEKKALKELNLEEKINFIFVGTLSKGKNPLYAIQLVENLYKKGYNVLLDLYGEGSERKTLEDYILLKGLTKYVTLKGNQNKKVVAEAYQNSHFVILPSQSEGWPKALAEGMFWGCVPLATRVSCVPFMLGYGKRGVFLQEDLELDLAQIEHLLNNKSDFEKMALESKNWSQQFTIDKFEIELREILRL